MALGCFVLCWMDLARPKRQLKFLALFMNGFLEVLLDLDVA